MQLDAAAATGRPTETITLPDLPAFTATDVRTALDRGARLATLTDGDGRTVLALGVDASGRIDRVTRGSGGDAIVTRIAGSVSGLDGGSWTVTEGESATPPTVTSLSVAREGSGWIHTATVGNLRPSTVTVDGDGRVTEHVDPAGITSTTAYLTGRAKTRFAPLSVTVTPGDLGEPRPETPAALQTTYTYQSGTDLVASITRPGPRGPLTTSIVRTPERTVVTAPDGTSTTDTLDALGRSLARTASTGAVTSLAYDDLAQGSGELASSLTTSAAGIAVTTITRDELGNATASTSTSGTTTRTSTSTVNALGWTLATTSGATHTATGYDTSGRVTRITSGGPDAPLVSTAAAYTSAGLIAAITRSGGALAESTAFGYDDAGRLTSTARSGDAGSCPGSSTTTYAYDTAGLTRSRTENPSLTTTTGYDPAGRAVTTTSPGGKVATTVFDTLGRTVGGVDPAGVRTDLTLLGDGSPSITRLKVGDAVWAEQQADYDTAGRATSASLARFPLPPGPGQTPEILTTTTTFYESGPQAGLVHTVTDTLGRVTTFEYDDAGRETERQLPDGTTLPLELHRRRQAPGPHPARPRAARPRDPHGLRRRGPRRRRHRARRPAHRDLLRRAGPDPRRDLDRLRARPRRHQRPRRAHDHLDLRRPRPDGHGDPPRRRPHHPGHRRPRQPDLLHRPRRQHHDLRL